MSNKILDNTFLSAVNGEITSVDVFSAVFRKYKLYVTNEVYLEASRGHVCKENLDCLNIFKDCEERYVNGTQYLKRRYGWIGDGENSSIVASVLLTNMGIDNYLVTDDRNARKIVPKITEDTRFEEIMGFGIADIRMTGTVGLICHLKNNGLLTRDDCDSIAEDLENSSFYIGPKIIDILKNC